MSEYTFSVDTRSFPAKFIAKLPYKPQEEWNLPPVRLSRVPPLLAALCSVCETDAQTFCNVVCVHYAGKGH